MGSNNSNFGFIVGAIIISFFLSTGIMSLGRHIESGLSKISITITHIGSEVK